ncbi:MAG TPA: hypothetical protein PKJ63_09535 [Cyclobacteriaceae bacterium]|nr:hypothetical protein [Cyclobacteriaceae bacterium]
MMPNKAIVFAERAEERMEEVKMEWNNIYITGQPGFKKEVSRKLDNTDLPFMPGYIGSTAGADDHDMYWLDKSVELRQFKEAIGAKLIWKYRIQFYSSLEAFISSQDKGRTDDAFTDKDLKLIADMRKAS